MAESWWIGLNRSELSAQSQTREFKQLPKSYVIPKIEDARVPKPILTDEERKKRQIQHSRKHQNKLLAQGKCEVCGTKCEINVKTNKPYTKCKHHRELKALWYKTYIRTRDLNRGPKRKYELRKSK